MIRARSVGVFVIVACSSSGAPTTPAPRPPSVVVADAAPAIVKATLTTDTPRESFAGNPFVAPAEWKIWTTGPATILEVPEGRSFIAIVDVTAKSADDAVAQAWAIYDPKQKRELFKAVDGADHDGWTRRKGFNYRTAPDEKRAVVADTFFANETWTVVIYDMAHSIGEKRRSQEDLIYTTLLPKGFVRESFAGKRAHVLDAERIARLEAWIEDAREKLQIPGVALGIVQDGKIVVARGFGVRDVTSGAKVDARTKFVVASMTKALTTLMLAKLVDEKRLTWETPVVQLMPAFALGDAATTAQVKVKHLICACTGMPKRNLEFLLEYAKLTPARLMEMLRTMQPTSNFGHLFQYSNYLGAAAGYVGGYVAYPKLELGKAYDEAMRTRVFTPLGMKSTTFDPKKARSGNWSRAYGHDHSGKIVEVDPTTLDAMVPVRPTGGAWSTVEDMLRYVQMELDDGAKYIGKDLLHARRTPQVALAKEVAYGMGLIIDDRKGLRIVSHGGNAHGHFGTMLWMPEHRVGAVLLVNSIAGAQLRDLFQQKLVEVLFDARPEVDGVIAKAVENYFDGRATRRSKMEVPADRAHASKLAAAYVHPTVGELVVRWRGDALIFDVGEWQSEVGTWKHVDGSVSFNTLAPGLSITVVPGVRDGKRVLVLREAQNEYVFVEK